MKNTVKIWSIILVLALVLGLFPAKAVAVEGDNRG